MGQPVLVASLENPIQKKQSERLTLYRSCDIDKAAHLWARDAHFIIFKGGGSVGRELANELFEVTHK